MDHIYDRSLPAQALGIAKTTAINTATMTKIVLSIA